VITDPQEIVFKGLQNGFKIGRYHSWAVKSENLPKELLVTATDEKVVMMALRHRDLDVRGVQFHPESVLTEYGKEMIANWLEN
jgi:anthranilate synthase component 2